MQRPVSHEFLTLAENANDSKLTASTPRTLPCRDPYLSSLTPPALVARLPPMWQLPFAPRSRGMVKPCWATWSSNVASTHPAWHTSVPAMTKNFNASITISWCMKGCWTSSSIFSTSFSHTRKGSTLTDNSGYILPVMTSIYQKKNQQWSDVLSDLFSKGSRRRRKCSTVWECDFVCVCVCVCVCWGGGF